MTTSMGSGDPSTRRTDYTPDRLGNLADDVTLKAVRAMAEHFADTEYARYFLQPADLGRACAGQVGR